MMYFPAHLDVNGCSYQTFDKRKIEVWCISRKPVSIQHAGELSVATEFVQEKSRELNVNWQVRWQPFTYGVLSEKTNLRVKR